MEPNSKDMTLLLQRMKGGDNDAANQLVALLYQELRRMARGRRHRAATALQSSDPLF